MKSRIAIGLSKKQGLYNALNARSLATSRGSIRIRRGAEGAQETTRQECALNPQRSVNARYIREVTQHSQGSVDTESKPEREQT